MKLPFVDVFFGQSTKNKPHFLGDCFVANFKKNCFMQTKPKHFIFSFNNQTILNKTYSHYKQRYNFQNFLFEPGLPTSKNPTSQKSDLISNLKISCTRPSTTYLHKNLPTQYYFTVVSFYNHSISFPIVSNLFYFS